MSYNRGNGGNRRNYKSNNNNQQTKKIEIDENNPILKSFQLYSSELLEKQDRYERITKQSRDITIESKRIIFLLHTVDSRYLSLVNVPNLKSLIDFILVTEKTTRLLSFKTQNHELIKFVIFNSLLLHKN